MLTRQDAIFCKLDKHKIAHETILRNAKYVEKIRLPHNIELPKLFRLNNWYEYRFPRLESFQLNTDDNYDPPKTVYITFWLFRNKIKSQPTYSRFEDFLASSNDIFNSEDQPTPKNLEILLTNTEQRELKKILQYNS